ncbi:hypothetical protein LSPH26S_03971 [Lysinibacillus sphaericus]
MGYFESWVNGDIVVDGQYLYFTSYATDRRGNPFSL